MPHYLNRLYSLAEGRNMAIGAHDILDKFQILVYI